MFGLSVRRLMGSIVQSCHGPACYLVSMNVCHIMVDLYMAESTFNRRHAARMCAQGQRDQTPVIRGTMLSRVQLCRVHVVRAAK